MAGKTGSFRRLIIIGAIAIVVSTLINICIGLFAKSQYQHIDNFAPLGPGPIIFWSVIAGIGAVAVFAGLKRWTRRPIQTYIIVAVVVYLCTFIPDDLLLSSNPPLFPGATAPAVLSLMAMHAAEAIIIMLALIVGESTQKRQL